MGKKLLSLSLLFSIFFLSPLSGFGQTCPTSVSISANTGNNICAGTNVIFTANPNGGSGTLTYQWKVDGVNAGTNSNQFPTSDLENGDKVTVTVTSADTTSCTISSSSYTMTVNANQTPTVSVSANKSSICPGESVTYTASNTNGGTSPQFSFYLNNGTSALQSGSSNTFTSTTLNNNDKIRVVMTSSLECVTSTTAEKISNSITVRAGTPAVPGTISGSTEVCPGTTQTYSISAVTGATSYQWTLPSGFSGSSTSTSINVTTGTSSGTISVKAINDCGTSEAENFAITVKAETPAVPGTITGTAAVCPEISETYTVAAVSGATEYIWSLPNGWTGASTTNSINVTTGTSGSGNISVQAKNDCGTSAAKTLAVSVKPGTPAEPSSINGTAAVCPGIQQTYSITGVTGATSYIWTLPNGWTGSSTTTSISVTSGTTGGNITVKATNDCGTSTEQTLAVTVKPGTPAIPGAVSGSNLVCPGTSETYSVSPINGATEYIWTLPSGWTGSSTSETITVTTGQSGSGNITVKAKNDCGTSTAESIAVSIDKPAPVMSGTVTGPVEVCSTATGLVYSIPAITNATEYLWTLPNGWSGTSTTNSISVSASSTSGNISVIAKNSCGESAASANLAVNSTTGAPATPGVISTNLTSTAICPVVENVTFSVDPVSNATGYNWILPTGWEITSGANTNSIKVKINASQSYASPTTVKVEATNICGKNGVSTSQDIFLDNYIVANIGPDLTVCKIVNSIPQLTLNGTMNFGNSNLSPTFTTTGSGTFQNVPSNKKGNFTVNYTPSAADYQLGEVKITMTIPKITTGNTTSCGTGVDEMFITFKNLPTATLTATSPICSGNTSTLTFTGTPNSRITYRLPNNSTQTVDIPSSGTINVSTAALTANSTYTLISAVNLDTPACTFNFPASTSTTVTVTPKPTATITYAGTPFCNSLSTAQNPTLTGTNAYTGGTYASTTGLIINTSTGAISPSTSTPGTYTVTYSTPQGGGCAPITATTQVTITNAPTASLSYSGVPFCTSDTATKAVSLTGTYGFSGGTFSAPTGLTINSSTGAITPSSSTAGTYIVTYQTPAVGGCAPLPFTTEVTITKAPTVTISYPDAPFCLSDTSLKSVTVTGTDAYTGGTYSAPAGLSINPSTGEINPSASSVGTHTVTYTSPATSGCGEVTATTDITITQTPAAEISYAGPYCTSDATAQLPQFSNTAGTFEGGVYRSTPEGLSLNTATGAINAQNSSPNTYTVFYELTAGAGCGTSEIQTQVSITQVPQLEISYITPLCTSDTSSYSAVFSSNAVGAYQNGSFTATPGLAIDSEGNINASNSTPGIHTITYTTPDANGCGPVAITTEIEIFEQPVITTPPVNVGICSTQPASFEVVASGENLTYQWKRVDGAAITNATGVNTAKLSFSNATETNAGAYFVEVSGSSPCSVAVSDPVTLNVDENIVIIKPTENEEFCDQERADVKFEFIAHAKGAPLTFTWIKDGADIPGTNTERFTFAVSEPMGENGEYTGTFKIVNPNPSDNGVYAVRINGPDYFTCSEATSKTFTLNVTPLPEPPTTEPVVLCQGETAAQLTASGATGATFKWYNSEFGDDLISGTPTPGTGEANIGNTSYWVSQTTEVCESPRTELVVTVNPTPALPTTQESVNYCFEEGDVSALTATGTDTNATINWYGPNDSTAKLDTAPVPVTTSTGITKYWVSQSIGDCESQLVLINVTIDPLPEIGVSADSQLICAGSSTTLRATGADSYSWTLNGEEIGTTAELLVSPSETSTYVLTGMNNPSECINTTEITIEVDEPTVPGVLTGPVSVCVSSPTGTLNLADYTGAIIRWEKTTDGSTWTNIAATTSSYTFNNLTTSTSFRAIVKNGVCGELPSNEIEVIIDDLPIGGELNFAGNERVFTICENPVGNYAVDLNLTGTVGEVVRWGYRSWDATTYTDLIIGGEIFTGTKLTADQIQSLNLNKTTVFQVEVRSGMCSPDALSKTAILSVIPSDITPSPVTVDPGVVCLGEEVTLSSETGYETGGTILDQGAFDNASITNHGWRIRREGISGDLGFDTDANNTEFDRWKRATPRAFTTASVNSPYNTSGVVFDTGIEDGNKGFALISGNYRSTMETPVFTIGSMDQAILTFDQAYVLTPGASIQVEISTDGGNTYTTLYIREVPADATQGIASGNTTSFGTGTIDSHPENKILIDLGDYIGRPNLRIRFNYFGARSGDIWAVDNIDIPEGPNGITMEWRDYTDPAFPNGILIGTNNSENYIPTEIGLNTFEVKTKLVYNSSGDACEVAENAQRVEVFVFDKYTTNVTASFGTCGNFSAQLTANVLNGKGEAVTSFPTPDGYIGRWEIVGEATLMDSNTTDEIAAINDPNAILSAQGTGTYTVSWILEPTEVDENGVLYANPEACPPIVTPLDVVIEGCIALDFDGFNDYVDLGTNYTGSNYSIEAWIRPFDRELEEGGLTDASAGTIISGPGFEIKMQDLPNSISTNGRWYHIAYTSDGKLYVDGILQTSNSISGVGGSQTLIGARWNSSEKVAENHFSGWIEEVRLWNGTINQDQIRFLMNQRLRDAVNIGVEIPMPAPGLDFTGLAGYYQLIAEPSLITAGNTPDLSNNAVPGRLVNMETLQENTAPLPYTTIEDGNWFNDTGTWTHADVWDPPHSEGVVNDSIINWNIVRTSHNVTANREIKVLGLISVVNTLEMAGTNPTAWVGGGTGNPLYISHYLKLDGNIDLQGESQLLQGPGSILAESSAGWLERDQQGTQDSYNYNYWSSPVSLQGAANNSGYSIKPILNNPKGIITYINDPYAADATGLYPDDIIISSYWLHTFKPGDYNVYGEWDKILENGLLKTGEGFTMKGTSGQASLEDFQNYTFRGKPHNGDFTLKIAQNQNYLIGNPYPSALDSEKFIEDNIKNNGNNSVNIFNGAIYFWQHFGEENTHILLEYVGGYGTRNLLDGVPAASIDYRINNSEPKPLNDIPGRYIPVGQSFMINSANEGDYTNGLEISGGEINFKNSQRIFITENSAESQFLRPEEHVKSQNKNETEIKKIRISYKSPKGYMRQILVGATPKATNGFDLGYDAPLFDYNKEDMYWIQGENWLVIQGVSNFDKEQVLPIGVVLDAEGEFTIKIDTLENMEDDKMVYIRDILNDTIHNLTKGPFVATSKGGYINDRFKIIFHKEEPPIEPQKPVDPTEPIPGKIPPGIELDVIHGHSVREFQILNPQQVDITNLYVYDLNGKLLQTYYNIANEKVVLLPVRNFSSGVYIIKLHTDNQVISKKIIISN